MSTSNLELPVIASQYPWIQVLLEVFDEDKLDREWVVRNLLGGMAAGFGLRGISQIMLPIGHLNDINK